MSIDPSLPRLLQLVSPSLPIGMYSYSQGLEGAVEEGWIGNAEAAGEWIGGLLENCIARVDLPLAARLYRAWRDEDSEATVRWSGLLLACRESAELRDEDRQTGQALARLLKNLGYTRAVPWIRRPDTTLAAMYTLAAAEWSVPEREALTGYGWSWLENQVLCAIKLVPLGQVAGQRLLHELAARLPALLERSLLLQDDDIGGSAFALTLASGRHENQYSRLFRS